MNLDYASVLKKAEKNPPLSSHLTSRLVKNTYLLGVLVYSWLIVGPSRLSDHTTHLKGINLSAHLLLARLLSGIRDQRSKSPSGHPLFPL